MFHTDHGSFDCVRPPIIVCLFLYHWWKMLYYYIYTIKIPCRTYPGGPTNCTAIVLFLWNKYLLSSWNSFFNNSIYIMITFLMTVSFVCCLWNRVQERKRYNIMNLSLYISSCITTASRVLCKTIKKVWIELFELKQWMRYVRQPAQSHHLQHHPDNNLVVKEQWRRQWRFRLLLASGPSPQRSQRHLFTPRFLIIQCASFTKFWKSSICQDDYHGRADLFRF